MVNEKKSFFARRGWLLLVVVLGLGVVALAGFHPSGFGHSPLEIHQDVISISNSCNSKFCQASCPAPSGNVYYKAVSGGCSSTVAGRQFNAIGVSGDQSSWNCFDSSFPWNPLPGDATQATVNCIQVGPNATAQYEFCGNYRIEPSAAPPSNIAEICDMNNTNPYDCGDFYTNDGNHLCNGTLQCDMTLSACRGWDISSCDYCMVGGCPPGYQYCSDHTCALSCDGEDSGVPVGGGAAGCQPGVNCPTLPGPPGHPFGGFCGDGLVQLAEECDGSGMNCAPDPTFHCPDGWTDTSTSPTCGSDCSCQLHNSCQSPCGDGIIQGSEECEPSDTSSCPLQTGGTWTCAACVCVWNEFGDIGAGQVPGT